MAKIGPSILWCLVMAFAVGITISTAEPFVPHIAKIVGVAALLVLAASNYRDGKRNA